MQKTVDINSKNILYERHQNSLLWYVQLLLCSGIVLWLLNPISEDIYILAGIVISWIIITTLMYGKLFFRIFLKKRNMYLFLWPIILVLYDFAGHASFSVSYIMYMFVFEIGVFYLIVGDKKTAKYITAISLVYLTVVSINTIAVYQTKPNISRILAYGDPEKIAYYGGTEYLTPFVAGYDIVYGVVFLLVGLMFLQKSQKNISRVIYIVLLGIYIFLVIKAQYFIAIVLSVLAFGFLFMMQRKHQQTKVLIGCVLIMGTLLLLGYGSSFFSYLADLQIFGYSLTAKFEEISQMLMGTIEGARAYYYGISISNFFDNIFFGSGTMGAIYQNSGNHSTILDAFAQFGLIGAIPFIMFYYIPIREIWKRLDSSARTPWGIVILLFIILGVLNRSTTRANYAILYIILPLIFGLLSNSVNEEKNNSIQMKV